MKPGSERPVVVDYDKAWPAVAGALASQLGRLLRPVAARVEHIGSTAIPSMAAKAVVDMQISVADLDVAAGAFAEPLTSLGFVLSPYRRDHAPAGEDDEPGRWAKRLWTRRAHPGGDVNLHVRVIGSPNERVALLFRDWFRAHPAAVPAYASFKRSLAAVTSDVGTYADVKDPVVDLVIVVAEQWALSEGWQP